MLGVHRHQDDPCFRIQISQTSQIGRRSGCRVRKDNRETSPTAEQLVQRYHYLVEHAPDAMLMLEHGIIVYVNRAAVQLVAASDAEELLGEPITRFMHPDSVAAVQENVVELFTEHAASVTTELTLVRFDGISVPVKVWSVLTSWHGELAHQVLLHDLTAHRAAETAQHRAEQFFASVVSQLEEGVMVIDADRRVESINPAGRRILGLEGRDDLLGTPITRLPGALLDANARPMPPAQYPVARTLATGEPVLGFVLGIDRPDGQRRWLSASSRMLNPGEPRSAAVVSFADITEFRDNRRQLEYQATHDPLTGLANRSLILSQLTRALAASAEQPVTTVMFVDLDNFKTINDSLGHAIGDNVLQIVAQRLQRALRAEDVVGRFGGDEFLVLLSGHGRSADLETLIARLRSIMSEPIVARGHRVEVGASVGVTEIAPGDIRTPEAVVHDADLAMYQAKPPAPPEDMNGPGHLPDTTHAS